ncbi:MAG: type III pantothenate kinase [Planctomycetaceae bacterium]|nr:type III pantothenate kinase [Planctomycetaceae bacterium]
MTAKNELMAVDIGNSRIKFGRYERSGMSKNGPIPQPVQVNFERSAKMINLDLWLRESPVAPGTEWIVSNVNETMLTGFCDWMLVNRPDDCVKILTYHDFKIPMDVDAPEKIGLDRLCNALAAKYLKEPGEPSLIVDIGTAVTLDMLSGDGRFRGGAIMPGFQTAAAALQSKTGQLPEIDADDLRFPEYPAKNTVGAIEAGLFWGMVGAIRQFLAFAQEGPRSALLLLTGGDAFPVLEALLNPSVNAKSDTVIAEATRVADPSGFSCPPVVKSGNTQFQEKLAAIPENSFVPVHQFHEAICCPYLTLSGIALTSVQ